MHISNDCDEENVNKLREKIGEFAFLEDPPFTHREVLAALMEAICGAIFSVTCPGCRAACQQFVNQHLPRLIDSTVKAADGRSGGENHVH